MTPRGAPVLALHGFTGAGEDFAPLAGADPWLMPDLVGHGPDPPREAAPYAMAAEVERLIALVDGLPPPIVLGYSMGGRLALSLAVALADRGRTLAGLALVGATPGLDDPRARAARRAADGALADRIEAIGVDAFLAEWQKTPIIASQARIAAPIRRRMAARRRHHRPWGLAGSLRGMGTGAMPSLWHRLDAIPWPTLLVTGSLDDKFAAIADAMAARMPSAARAVIDGAGHCAHLERPAAFRAVFDRWRAGVGG